MSKSKLLVGAGIFVTSAVVGYENREYLGIKAAKTASEDEVRQRMRAKTQGNPIAVKEREDDENQCSCSCTIL